MEGGGRSIYRHWLGVCAPRHSARPHLHFVQDLAGNVGQSILPRNTAKISCEYQPLLSNNTQKETDE
jgi:hypothetical protein